MRLRILVPVAALCAVAPCMQAQSAPSYRAWVASEATDRLFAIDFDGRTATVRDQIEIGVTPMDPDGPHGLGFSPDGRFVYVSTAHGSPFGYLWKLDAIRGTVVGRVELGNFPASLQVSPDGGYVYVANFNLHGDMVPSSISIVGADDMVEVARIQTCAMPHGSRFNGAGTRQYSTCMMDEYLVEIDALTFAVSRHLKLTRGQEMGMAGPPHGGAHHAAGAADQSGHGMAPVAPGGATCSPTWAAPLRDGSKVYVACNRSNEIVEVDVATWAVTRRIPSGDGVYNLAVTRDGRTIVATNKRAQSVSIIDIASGRELARLPTRRRVVHGVAITPDDRYAFISVEGIGSEPGTVEIIDLVARRTVATLDVGQQAGGIDVR